MTFVKESEYPNMGEWRKKKSTLEKTQQGKEKQFNRSLNLNLNLTSGYQRRLFSQYSSS